MGRRKNKSIKKVEPAADIEIKTPFQGKGRAIGEVRRKNKSKKKVEPAADIEKKTPCQGDRRSFGEFQCQTCKKHWYSANSRANMGQKCMKCKIYVYPHRQWELEKRERNNESKKSHPCQLCEKCKQIGGNCVTYAETD